MMHSRTLLGHGTLALLHAVALHLLTVAFQFLSLCSLNLGFSLHKRCCTNSHLSEIGIIWGEILIQKLHGHVVTRNILHIKLVSVRQDGHCKHHGDKHSTAAHLALLCESPM